MTMKQAKWLVVTLLVIGILGYVHSRNPMQWGKPDRLALGPATQVEAPADCQLRGQGCMVVIDDIGSVFVRLPEQIRSLEKFTLEVRPDTELARNTGAVHANFDMIDMDMGFNDYVLERSAAGDFTATVILPVCSADRSDWIVDIFLTTTHGTFVTRLPFELPRR